MAATTPVLAALDLSAHARHAAARAMALGTAANVPVTLLHMMQNGPMEALRRWMGSEADDLQGRLLAQAQSTLDDWRQRYAGADRQGLVHPAIRTADVLQGILDEAEQLDASLLVVGARGESFMRHHLLGSTAERLLRASRRPVLVVRAMPQGPYRRVLVPVDFSPWSLPAVRMARTWAPDAEILLMHVFEAPFENKLLMAGVSQSTLEHYLSDARRQALEQLDALRQEASVGPVRLIVRHGVPAWAVLEQEQDDDCDLIVVGKHGQGRLEEMLLGSLTRQLLASASADVLVAPGPPQAEGGLLHVR